MAQILYRQLINGDTARGNGLGNFLTDLQAVAQAIYTTLKLLQGEWWTNLSAGTPLFQSILGVASTSNGVALILQNRIQSVPYVLSVTNLVINFVGATRVYTFSCTVQTAFGTLVLNNQQLPGTQAVLPS